MSGRWPFTAEKIATRLNLIEPYIFRKRQILSHLQLMHLPAALVDPPICSHPSGWEEIPHQTYWGRTDLNFVLKTCFTVPDGWDAANIALHLPLGVMGDIFNHPEALVHIDTKPIGSADRYHHTIPLESKLLDGQQHVLSLHGWTGHASWPLDPDSKAKLFMGEPALVERDPTLLAFHGFAKAALDAARVLPPDSQSSIGILAALDNAFITLDTRDPIGEALYESVDQAMSDLQTEIAAVGAPLDVTLHGIGHAHMDIAYLWPISQTRLKNARTYSNVLRLMDENPGYCFSHSQPQLYDYAAQDYPEIFRKIKQRVAEGRWEIMGGMWVEPDLNIPGSEALVRQLMLGRQYFKDSFNVEETPVLWLPDTFGFPGQTPQLMRHAGLKWFATNKLNWNQKNKVPSTSHHWEGIDGSRILAHILTTPRPVQYLPFPTNYKSDLSAAELLGTWRCSSAPDCVTDLPICYGYGDGGGGPTEELLAKAHANFSMPDMPKFKMSTVRDAFECIEHSAEDLPIWRGEHYMEGHRGVLTSQAWIKRANRKAEWALHEAEALCAMAGISEDLEQAWKLLCLNQFHDIITGASVSEVFDDSRRDFEEIAQLVETVAEKAAQALSSDQALIANTSPSRGPRLAFIPGTDRTKGQLVEGGSLVHFEDLQPYSVTALDKATIPQTSAQCALDDKGAVLKNAALRIRIDANGKIAELFDKTVSRSALGFNELGNTFIAFEDRPICWDAWDIDPFIEDRSEIVNTPCKFEIVENGPLRASIKVSRLWRRSTITQTIRLTAGSSRVDFETEIDWHETHTLLKVAFPTSVQAPTALFDIQWGAIERSTSSDTDFDAARFEVPLHKWVQLSEDNYSVAVLNDCKYGCDVHGETIRLTLIKSATYPDPEADQGRHKFTYSLLSNSFAQRTLLDQHAYDLNSPLRLIAKGSGKQPTCEGLITSSAENALIETVKPAADADGIIVRLFEAHGRTTDTILTYAHDLTEVNIVDFMEDPLMDAAFSNRKISLCLKPFEIVSLRLK